MKNLDFTKEIIVNNIVKILLVLALAALFINLKTKSNEREKDEDDYEVYVDQVVNTFANEMREKYGLRCCGSGGSMPYNVETIIVNFIILKKTTLEEARIIEVNAVERLIELVNNHEKIRPYLAEYPFNSSRTKISISFNDKSGLSHTDGTITYVSLIKNKIFFKQAEKVTRKKLSGETYEADNLITLLEEPYEVALEKVKASNKLVNSNTTFDKLALEKDELIEEKE